MDTLIKPTFLDRLSVSMGDRRLAELLPCPPDFNQTLRELMPSVRTNATLPVCFPIVSLQTAESGNKSAMARAMLLGAMDEGRLEPGMTVIVPSSGNTGLRLVEEAQRIDCGIDVIVVMKASEPREKIDRIRSRGAGVAFPQGGETTCKCAVRLAGEQPKRLCINQYSDPYNLAGQYVLAKEAYKAFGDRKPDVIVVVCGTTATACALMLHVGRETEGTTSVVPIVIEEDGVVSGARTRGAIGRDVTLPYQSIFGMELGEIPGISAETAHTLRCFLWKRHNLNRGPTTGLALGGGLMIAEHLFASGMDEFSVGDDGRLVVGILSADSGDAYPFDDQTPRSLDEMRFSLAQEYATNCHLLARLFSPIPSLL